MGELIIPESHLTFTAANEVDEICQPLFKYYGITNFFYLRVYDTNHAYLLINNREYVQYHIQKEYMVTPPIPENMLSKNFMFLALPDQFGPYNQLYYEARSLFNIDNIIYFIERFDNYYDSYAFSSTPNNPEIINFYLNNIDILDKFKYYFKEKAAKLIEQAEKDKTLLPVHMRPNFGGLNQKSATGSNGKKEILNQLAVHRYMVNAKNKKYYFTKREMDCMRQLQQGHTLKEIAKLMAISPRTVEYYLDNVKDKLNIRRKSEILTAIDDLNMPLDSD